MMAAAYLSYRQRRIPLDLVKRHRELLSLYGLPVAKEFSLGDLTNVWSRNKRYRSGVKFIVLNGIGEPEGGILADEEILSKVLMDLSH